MQLPPAQLWVGSHDHLVQHVTTYLQEILCTDTGCATCNTCQHIQEQQHHNVSWLAPVTNYTIDQITELQQRMSFVLEDHEHHFFILQKAEALTTVCSNRLLKSIEEPPTGYHFIFLAQQKEALLKTIQSRCLLKTFQSESPSTSQHPIYTTFISRTPDPILFEKTLATNTPNERESLELTQALFSYWATEYKQNANAYTLACVNLFKYALTKPAMPGSSKVFWKNLFLQLTSCVDNRC